MSALKAPLCKGGSAKRWGIVFRQSAFSAIPPSAYLADTSLCTREAFQHGRQLATMSDGSTTWTFTYDADGMRTKKTNGTQTYTYVYNGGSLSQMTRGADTLRFSYDASGVPLTLTYNGTTYYYITNIQGDVIGIANQSGQLVVQYLYNAWGVHLETTGTMAATLGQLNPLRYRGYVYDTETELYYLQSRYYDPELGRFINADGFVSTGQCLLGNNMFAYCLNNPVSWTDFLGKFAANIFATSFLSLGLPILPYEIDSQQKSAREESEDAIVVVSPPLLLVRPITVGQTGAYKDLRKITAGHPEYEVHHLIERRFYAVPGLEKYRYAPNNAPSVILIKETHRGYTNSSRAQFGYGSTKYRTLDKTQVMSYYRMEYRGHPDWLELLSDYFK